ncbi:CoA transferase [Thalassotalea fonticola]|uniref:CoA transferase n=1 Tax=Thalassotalea fonticola TaxID=3065649 RepID=A0ABZ0GSG6_9GAMM|nr:CoA transferase [Colwelliaceae bacterium S1-1]
MTQQYFLSLIGPQKHDPALTDVMLSRGNYYEYFRTADDRYLSLGTINKSFLLEFLDNIGQFNWQKFISSGDENEQQILRESIRQVISEKDLGFWTELLRTLDIFVSPVPNKIIAA